MSEWYLLADDVSSGNVLECGECNVTEQLYRVCGGYILDCPESDLVFHVSCLLGWYLFTGDGCQFFLCLCGVPGGFGVCERYIAGVWVGYVLLPAWRIVLSAVCEWSILSRWWSGAASMSDGILLTHQ